MITERITKLKKMLSQVTRTRSLHRRARKRVPYPVVALVGYTNAGKSTLFNRLTNSEVFAKDLLFATLDPTLRQVKLPSGRMVILSDTVGFISDLPTDLIAAFRATLEEVIEADLILHVRDVSDPESDLHRNEVIAVLKDLNKIDLLEGEEAEFLANQAGRDAGKLVCSALTGEGSDQLLKAIDDHLARSRETVILEVPLSDGEALAWLYRSGEVLKRSVLLGADDLARFEQRFGIKGTRG